MDRLLKNRRISLARQQTITRHRSMVCKTYELKVDKSHLSRNTAGELHLLFVEARWFYNAVVAAMRDGVHFDYRTLEVLVRNKDKRFEVRSIKLLSSQMRQEILDRAKDNLKSLARLKENGRRVGSLRFVSRVRSIPLKQYGITYGVEGDHMKIQGIGRIIRVRGMDQVPKGAELASATLIERGNDCFVHITTYLTEKPIASPKSAIGIDCGIKRQLLTSNGVAVMVEVPLTKSVGRLHRELSRRKLRGRNRRKTNDKLNCEYTKITNRKLDARHKIVSYLTSNYECVATQNDHISAWQRLWGRRVLSTAIGGIMSDLRSKPRTPVVVERFVPTTKKCCHCGSKNEIGLGERVYKCSACGLAIDRDLNAAINMWLQIPAERRELTPVDTKSATEMLRYFNGIPHVSASLVEETGSHSISSRW